MRELMQYINQTEWNYYGCVAEVLVFPTLGYSYGEGKAKYLSFKSWLFERNSPLLKPPVLSFVQF